MAGLLDFALGFGAGAAGAVAQDRASQLEMQRKANLERLRAQYAGEVKEQEITATARLISAARGDGEDAQAAADRLTAMGVNWRQGASSSQSPQAKLWDDYQEAVRAGDVERAESLRRFIDASTAPSDDATIADKTKELRIQRLMRANPDWTYSDAVREVEGVDRIITDPVTGRSSVVGRGSGGQFSGRELAVERGVAPERRPTPSATQIEDLAFDPGDGTGLFAVGKSVYNSTLGQLPILPIFTGVESAAQVLTVIQRDAVNMLASSGRPPVIEQERIVRMLPQPLDWSENPRIASLRLSSFVDVVGLQYRADLDALDEPSLSQTERRELNSRIRKIESIVGRILTPEATERFLAQRDRPSDSSINRIMNNYDSAIIDALDAEYDPIQIPRTSLSPNLDLSEEEFLQILDDLEVRPGMRYILPWRPGQVFRRPL